LTFSGSGPFNCSAPEWCVRMVKDEGLHPECHDLLLPLHARHGCDRSGRLRESGISGQ
jgi:hypothetical protein